MSNYQIKEITVVEGWTLDGSPYGGKKVFDGHIDLRDAIRQSGDIIDIKNEAYVTAEHRLEIIGLEKLSGNANKLGL